MFIYAASFLAISTLPIPDVEYEVTAISSNATAGSANPLSIVRVACRSGKCELAIATLQCGSGDLVTWQHGSDVMNIAIYSPNDRVSTSMHPDGWLEIRTVSSNYSHTHRFKLNMSNDKAPILIDYVSESSFMDFTGTKTVTRMVALKDTTNFVYKTCMVQLPVIPEFGQRVRYAPEK